MRIASALRSLGLFLGLLLPGTGCIEAMLTNGEIEGTRRGAAAMDTVADFELARSATQAGLAQFEGMHRIAPKNEDALFLLTQGWGGYAWGFVEDEMEIARDRGDDDLADYHRGRAHMAYDRAIFYGLELLGHEADGFAQASRNDKELRAWLAKSFTEKEDAVNLFWTGYAWMSRVSLLQDDPAMVADLFVGVSMMQRSLDLDPDYYGASAMVAMAAYHGRSADAEVDLAKKLFEQALEKTQHKTLTVQLTYAQLGCILGDKGLYDRMLNEVLVANDPDPQQRLNNMLAKRRARRYLSPVRTADCGFMTK